MSILQISLNEFVSLLRAILHCKRAGNFERVKAMQIAACGQDAGITQNVTPRCRQDVAAV